MHKPDHPIPMLQAKKDIPLEIKYNPQFLPPHIKVSSEKVANGWKITPLEDCEIPSYLSREAGRIAILSLIEKEHQEKIKSFGGKDPKEIMSNLKEKTQLMSSQKEKSQNIVGKGQQEKVQDTTHPAKIRNFGGKDPQEISKKLKEKAKNTPPQIIQNMNIVSNSDPMNKIIPPKRKPSLKEVQEAKHRKDQLLKELQNLDSIINE